MAEPTPPTTSEPDADVAMRARPAETTRELVGIKLGDLVTGPVVAVTPDVSLREAARVMNEHGTGSVIVEDADGALAGILTERDLLRCLATSVDVDATPVDEVMTREVITASPDWEVYEGAAEMTDHRIRHLVVTDGPRAVGVVSVRDLLLAGQRVELTGGAWVVFRDPLTLSVRERRRLQRTLLRLDPGPRAELDVDELVGQVVASWSFALPLPPDAETLGSLSEEDRRLLRAAMIEELPELQRAVQPAPGWRRWADD